MQTLRPGWYIFLYHDVSWEENCYLRSIGGTCPPDIFRQHLNVMRRYGRVVSPAEGMRAWQDGITEPLFSLWFDDGLKGVSRYVAPILTKAGVSAAVSVNSRFLDRSEFFWRFKMSYLNSIDGMRFLRSRMKRFGYQFGKSLRRYSIDHFNKGMLDEIDDLFQQATHQRQREDAFRLFLNHDDLAGLVQAGWTIANHTAAHYPVLLSDSTWREQFLECEERIRSVHGLKMKYWVLPFGRMADTNLSLSEQRWLVLNGGKVNLSVHRSEPKRVLYRLNAPICGADRFETYLRLMGAERSATERV